MCENTTKQAGGRIPNPQRFQILFFFSLFLGFFFLIAKEIHAYYWKVKSKHSINNHHNNSVHPEITTVPSIFLSFISVSHLSFVSWYWAHLQVAGNPALSDPRLVSCLLSPSPSEGKIQVLWALQFTGFCRPSLKQGNTRFRYKSEYVEWD